MAQQVLQREQAGAGEDTFQSFDPDRLAYLEVAGWRAYYDRKWMRLLTLLIKMEREQFGFSWLRAIQGAYYITRASIAWVPLDHDLRAIRRDLRKFYRLVVKHGRDFHFDPVKVADLELRYWHYNRQLAQTEYDENSALVRSLAELHAAMFDISPQAVRESARERALSLHTVALITGKRSTDIEGDWQRAEEHLRKAYRCISLGASHAGSA